ncbi:hypothetical protein LCGC14_0598130 [marine sediment metagenome]|uniref:Uncharacterized protein n=1 Tax=marine sediment metagenome TaxID=412755 RepID=A0A0F9RGA1_9ZZZZ
MKKWDVYIPYNTFTEHIVEAESPKQARKIAMDMGNLDKELLENLEVHYEYIDVEEII